MRICGKTDPGMTRASNQDAFAVLERSGYSLAVLCDGVGGANGGETASRTALQVFCNSVRSSLSALEGPPDDGRAKDILTQAVTEANAEVFRLAQENPELAGMGTTLVAALVCPKAAYVINVGDSRLYLLSKEVFRQVTKDHSFIQYLLDKQIIRPEEAKTHPNRNVILRSIGNTEDVQPDFFRIPRGDFDQLLLCSDGLYNMVDASEIRSVVSGAYKGRRRPPWLRRRAAELIRRANRNGGTDNITVVIVCEDGC